MVRRVVLFALIHAVFVGLVWTGGVLAGSGKAPSEGLAEASGYAIAPAALLARVTR